MKLFLLLTLTTLPCAISSQSKSRLVGGIKSLTKPASLLGLFSSTSTKYDGNMRYFEAQDDSPKNNVNISDAYDYLIGAKLDTKMRKPTLMYRDLAPSDWLAMAQRYYDDNNLSQSHPEFSQQKFESSVWELSKLYFGGLEEMATRKVHTGDEPKRHPVFLEIMARLNKGAKVLRLYQGISERGEKVCREQERMIQSLIENGYTEALRALDRQPLHVFYAQYRVNHGPEAFIRLCFGLFKNRLVSDDEIRTTLSLFTLDQELENLIMVKHGIVSRRHALVKEHVHFLQDKDNKYAVLLTLGEYLRTMKPERVHADVIRACLQGFDRFDRNRILRMVLRPAYNAHKQSFESQSEFLQFSQQFNDLTGPISFVSSHSSTEQDSDDDEPEYDSDDELDSLLSK